MKEIDLFEAIDENQLTCPYCGSEEIYWYLIDLENSRNGIRCDDCKATWWKDIVGYYTQWKNARGRELDNKELT